VSEETSDGVRFIGAMLPATEVSGAENSKAETGSWRGGGGPSADGPAVRPCYEGF